MKEEKMRINFNYLSRKILFLSAQVTTLGENNFNKSFGPLTPRGLPEFENTELGHGMMN